MMEPRYMTPTEELMCRTTFRSWEIKIIDNCISCCSSIIRFRIWAWMETSRAETGSSATTKLGWVIRARAMEMRCFWPPENWWG